MKQEFQAVLDYDEDSSATVIIIPFDVEQAFAKRGRVPVRGTLNALPYRSSIFRMGEAPYFMVVNRQMREAGGFTAGQTVSVVMERDDEPRTVEIPADLQSALEAHEGALSAWDKLSFTHRREHIEAINGAKHPETRVRRIEKALSHLSAGK